eukprot:TRINITY_DN76865_c0_g1_i1.p1 TRINITY_DN76865_c0_g1~~TRINITY_DN76865_c0_g1_i1.p1  ORF type:complete len:434 (-),score=49.45 TRINITY_DN76865_c0_g1_i1:95-1396(-)
MSAGESTPLVNLSPGRVSDAATVVSLLKLIIGAGGFAFPWAFARMGIVGGAIALIGVAGLGSFTISELAALKAQVEVSHGRKNTTYADVAHASLGPWGAYLVLVMTVFAGGGGMCAYVAYVSTTLESLVPSLGKTLFVLLTGIILLPVIYVEDFSVLSQVAGVGTLAVLLGYVGTLGYAILALSPSGHPKLTASLAATAEGFGPIAFLLCIHFAIFPLLSCSSASSRPGRFDRLAAFALGTAAVINGIFGAVGLIYFGPHVSSIVLNDIPADYVCLVVTKLLVCADLLCTYPLLFGAASQIVESFVVPLLDEPRQTQEEASKGSGHVDTEMQPEAVEAVSSLSLPHCVRLTIHMLTTLGGGTGGFGQYASLTGALSLTTMAFILPPLMTLAVFRRELSTSRAVLDISILILGSFVAVLSTGVTVANMFGVHVA